MLRAVMVSLHVFMLLIPCVFFFFFFNDTATTEIYTLSLHDALPIFCSLSLKARISVTSSRSSRGWASWILVWPSANPRRSEEHTSELQSPCNLVCRLLLEKKKKKRPRLSPLSWITHYDTQAHTPSYS